MEGTLFPLKFMSVNPNESFIYFYFPNSNMSVVILVRPNQKGPDPHVDLRDPPTLVPTSLLFKGWGGRWVRRLIMNVTW